MLLTLHKKGGYLPLLLVFYGRISGVRGEATRLFFGCKG
jgi:hypothetical protein